MHTFAVIFMVAAFAVIVGVDIVLAVNNTKGDTFSSILKAAARRCIASALCMAFGMGLLAGHWYW